MRYVLALWFAISPIRAFALGGEGIAGDLVYVGLIAVILLSLGIPAFFSLVVSGNRGFAVMSVVCGVVAAVISPPACQGQPSGYHCPDTASLLAFAIPFFGITCAVSIFAWLMAPRDTNGNDEAAAQQVITSDNESVEQAGDRRLLKVVIYAVCTLATAITFAYSLFS